MGRTLRIAGFVLLALLAVAGGIGGWFYYASQQTPDFYREALAMDPAIANQASQEMVNQTTQLVNRVQKPGVWQQTFTAQQINGWLAVDRVKNHPQLLPKEFADPRIALEPQSAIIGCLYDNGDIRTVVSLEVDAYVSEPNVVAVRIHRAFAGLAPLPLGQVLEAIKKGAEKSNVALEWRQIDGDPVALFTIPPSEDQGKHALRIEKLELRAGEVLLAGRTEPAPAPQKPSPAELTADRSADQLSRQR